MNAVTRRVLEMCVRLLSWMSAHPDDEPGSSALAARFQALVAQINQLVSAQRNGLIDVRAASARKQELRREMLAVPIAHLAEIGRRAAQEVHELGKTFRFRPTAGTLAAFQSAARGMYSEAVTHKEVLVKHGLSESVLVEFGRMVDDFDAAVKLGNDGRTAHKAATRELDVLTLEVGRIVRGMDARNRIRFRNDRQALEQWIAARTVLGTPREPAEAKPPEPQAGGDVRPAA